MRIAIVDDAASDRSRLQDLLTQSLHQRGYLDLTIDPFPDGADFLAHFRAGAYDLIFLDIYMQDKNGIETGMQLRALDTEVQVVFVTSANDFASESYQVRASYYLLKPATPEAIDRMFDQLNPDSVAHEQFVVLPNKTKVLLREITHTEYYNHTVLIHLKHLDPIRIRMSQTELEELLCSHASFRSCSKGIVVNLAEIAEFQDGVILLKNNSRIPMSRRRSKEIRDAHAEFLFRRVRKGAPR